MPAATNAQVQQYVNERVRVRAEQLRNVLYAMEDDKAAIDDVYTALTQQNPTWTDTRTDAPPHLLSPADVLAWNTFVTNIIAAMRNDGQLPVVLRSCVRTLGV